jgi:agmatinase
MLQFLSDVPAAVRTFERARVLVLPAPYEESTSYLKGTARGPEAILEASQVVENYDDVLGQETWRVGIHVLPALDVSGGPQAVVARLEARIAALPPDRFIVTLGGEHTVTVGALRAAVRRHGPLGLLVFDAHDDLRDAYEGSPLSHACASRRAAELGPVVQVGIRSVSPDGVRIARRLPLSDNPKSRIQNLKYPVLSVPAHEIHHRGMPTAAILAALPERVYLSVDIDAFDPACCPGVGTPEPGGLDWYQVTDLIAAVARSRRIVALDVNEVRPLADTVATEYFAARLIYRTLGGIFRAAVGS